jgi:hypothetical protein
MLLLPKRKLLLKTKGKEAGQTKKGVCFLCKKLENKGGGPCPKP